MRQSHLSSDGCGPHPGMYMHICLQVINDGQGGHVSAALVVVCGRATSTLTRLGVDLCLLEL